MKHNFKILNTVDMKQIIKYLQQFKQWILSVVIWRFLHKYKLHDWRWVKNHICNSYFECNYCHKRMIKHKIGEKEYPGDNDWLNAI